MGEVGASFGETNADRHPPSSGGEQHLIPIDQKVLNDLRHSLGNYLHRLYYCADCLKSGADDLGPDLSPVEMLDRTIQNLDGFLRVALEYFRPPDLSCVTLNGEELGRAVASALHSAKAGRSEVVAGPGVERWHVAIDPSRFSEALAIVAKQIRAAAGDQTRPLNASVEEAAAQAALRLELRLAGEKQAGSRRELGVVEWAVAGRLLAAHGGSLEPISEEGVIAGCVIYVPAQAS